MKRYILKIKRENNMYDNLVKKVQLKHPNYLEKDTKGILKCPNCKKDLWYLIISYNRHVFLRCSTKDCLFYMK